MFFFIETKNKTDNFVLAIWNQYVNCYCEFFDFNSAYHETALFTNESVCIFLA